MALAENEVVEGRWEDLLLRSNEFYGKRVRISVVADGVPDHERANLFHATPEERARALDEIAQMNTNLPVLPPEAYNRESLYDESLE